MIKFKAFGPILVLILMRSSSLCTAAEVENFYKGKNIIFVIGSSAGGGFDVDGRLMARHIGNELLGKPSVVPQNMPGAGSIRAADYLYFSAPKDGTVIGIIDPGVYNSQLLGEAGIRFDTANFTWLGRMVNNTPVVFTWHNSPIQKASDLFEKEAIISASGPTPKLNYLLLNTVLKAKIKTINAYPGSAQAMLAMERGEIHGLSTPWPVMKASKADWVKEKKVLPILQTGIEKHPEIYNVPRMIDLAKNEQDRALFEFIGLPSLIGRAMLAPPAISEERKTNLRGAFDRMVRNPKFIADANNSKIDLEPMSGELLQKILQEKNYVSETVINRAREIASSPR